MTRQDATEDPHWLHMDKYYRRKTMEILERLVLDVDAGNGWDAQLAMQAYCQEEANRLRILSLEMKSAGIERLEPDNEIIAIEQRRLGLAQQLKRLCETRQDATEE